MAKKKKNEYQDLLLIGAGLAGLLLLAWVISKRRAQVALPSPQGTSTAMTPAWSNDEKWVVTRDGPDGPITGIAVHRGVSVAGKG